MKAVTAPDPIIDGTNNVEGFVTVMLWFDSIAVENGEEMLIEVARAIDDEITANELVVYWKDEDEDENNGVEGEQLFEVLVAVVLALVNISEIK